jgi:hypothetical protein
MSRTSSETHIPAEGRFAWCQHAFIHMRTVHPQQHLHRHLYHETVVYLRLPLHVISFLSLIP